MSLVIINSPQPIAVPTTYPTGGPPGPPGTGSTIGVTDETVDLGSAFSRLKFTGNVAASDAGGGVAQIYIPPDAGAGVSTRTALAAAADGASDNADAYLTEGGREGKFIFYSAARFLSTTGLSLTSFVSADTRQGMVIPKASDPTGASGAFVRRWNRRKGLWVRWFGAVLDDATDDHLAVLSARDLSFFLALNPGSSPYYKVGPAVVVDGPAYLAANSYDMKHTHELRGINVSGLAGNNYPSWLRVSGGVDVIIAQRFDTSSTGTIDGVTHFGADGSRIANIALKGDYSTTEGDAHLIRTKCRLVIDEVMGTGARGAGLFCHADSASSGTDHGNANLGVVRNSSFIGNRDGMDFSGADANVWRFEGQVDTSQNRRWGRLFNDILLTIDGGHSADNGLIPGTAPSVVSNGGLRYAIKDGQETAGSTTAPTGTVDTSVWYYQGAGGVSAPLNIPAWVSGMTLRAGGAARYKNANSRKLILAPYAEDGQGPIQADAPTMVVQPQADVRGTAGVLKVNAAGILYANRLGALDKNGNGIQFGNGIDNPLLEILTLAGDDLTLVEIAGNFAMGVLAGGATHYELTGETTTRNVGKRRLNFPFGYGNGDLKELVGTAAPTSGTYVQGDRMRNSAPAVGQPKGWVCTVGGTPGTWVSEGNL